MKEKRIPTIDLDGDMTDEQNYFSEKTAAKLSSFYEILSKVGTKLRTNEEKD
jgi:hypothetical protein